MSCITPEFDQHVASAEALQRAILSVAMEEADDIHGADLPEQLERHGLSPEHVDQLASCMRLLTILDLTALGALIDITADELARCGRARAASLKEHHDRMFGAEADACPGCGRSPGEGLTKQCHHPLGCGASRRRAAQGKAVRT